MSLALRTSLAAACAALTLAAPAQAQSFYYADNVAFFEQVYVGGLEVTPIGIRRDTRCADERFCTRENRLIISVMLNDYRGKREVVLELGRPAPVPGGYLLLTDPGTRPALRGAIRLDQYALDLEFIPLDVVFDR